MVVVMVMVMVVMIMKRKKKLDQGCMEKRRGIVFYRLTTDGGMIRRNS